MEHKCKKSDSKTIEKCELNREQVIKALEHVKSYGKITQYNAFHTVTNALALIKELTEENERMGAERNRDILIVRRRCAGKTEKAKSIIRMRVKDIQADTVRKMQERFSILLKKEYEENTPEGSSFYFKNGSLMMWSIAGRVFDQIAKEMLEE